MKSPHDIAPRHAAFIAGLGYLLTPTPFPEFYVWPHLVIAGNAEQTARNILAHETLFAFGVACYILSYVLDVVIAWALYYLLKPVSAPLAMLAAWFQLVYTAVGLGAALRLATIVPLLNTPDAAAALANTALRAQAQLILASFHPIWGLSLILFGVHLLLVGTLIYKSGYIPKYIGIAVALAGAAYIVQNFSTYLFPQLNFGYGALFLLGELLFMFWLLIRGRNIPQPPVSHAP